MINIARDIMNNTVKRYKDNLPIDAVCAKSPKDVSEKTYPIDEIPPKMMGLDIGPNSVIRFNEILGNSKTILWNGPMGVFELKHEYGTREIAIHLVSCVASG